MKNDFESIGSIATATHGLVGDELAFMYSVRKRRNVWSTTLLATSI
jgi:hypothetical protein